MTHDNTRIADKRPLLPPAILIEEIPLSNDAVSVVDKDAPIAPQSCAETMTV